LPKVKYREFVEKLRSASIFTFKSVESVVGRSYAKLLIHNLRKEGKIIELIKGVYTFKKSPYMIVKAIPKSYIGLGSAAFLHGAWGQVTRITVLSPYISVKVKGGEREISGHKVILRKISEKMYFGYEFIFLEEIEEWVRVSDKEKTLLDMIYYDYPFKDEIIPNLLDFVSLEKLKRYSLIIRRRKVRGFRRIQEELKRIGV